MILSVAAMFLLSSPASACGDNNLCSLSRFSNAAAVVEVVSVEKKDGVTLATMRVRKAAQGKLPAEITAAVFPPDPKFPDRPAPASPKAGERALVFLRSQSDDFEKHGLEPRAGLFALTDDHAGYLPVEKDSEREKELVAAIEGTVAAGGDKKAQVKLYLKLLAGKDPLLQRAGAKELHFELEEERDVEAASKILLTGGMDADAAVHLAEALGNSGHPKAAEALIKVLDAKPGLNLLVATVRAAATFGYVEEAAAVRPKLIAALTPLKKHPSDRVRRWVEASLRSLSPRDGEPREPGASLPVRLEDLARAPLFE